MGIFCSIPGFGVDWVVGGARWKNSCDGTRQQDRLPPFGCHQARAISGMPVASGRVPYVVLQYLYGILCNLLLRNDFREK